MPKAYHLGILPSDHTLALVLGLAFGVIAVLVTHPRRFPLRVGVIPFAQGPLQPFVRNLQRCQLSRATPVHNDKFGDVLVGLSQVEASRFQLCTQQGALALQHLNGCRHPQFKARVIDQIVFHRACVGTVCACSFRLGEVFNVSAMGGMLSLTFFSRTRIQTTDYQCRLRSHG